MTSNEENLEPALKKIKSCENSNIENGEGAKNTTSEEDEIMHDDDHHLFEFPLDDDIEEMLTEVALDVALPTVTDRYFIPYYKLDVQRPRDDICIRIHSNRICMLSLAPSHELLEEGRHVANVSFRVSDKLDRASNKVSGKGKHGAQPLQSNSNICVITSSNGQNYTIKCVLTGKLVEVNESLITNPQLLKEPPHRGGYLAIMLPNLKLIEETKKALLTQSEYEAALLERKSKMEKQLEEQEVEVRNVNSSVKNGILQ